MVSKGWPTRYWSQYADIGRDVMCCEGLTKFKVGIS